MIISVNDGAEPHLERQFLPRVAVKVEAESVQAFVAKCIWSGSTCIGIHGHGHDGETGSPAEEVEIADVNSGIFPGCWRVEVVGHSLLPAFKRQADRDEPRRQQRYYYNVLDLLSLDCFRAANMAAQA